MSKNTYPGKRDENSSQVRLGEGKRRRRWQRVRWLDSITDSMDVNLSKLQELVKGRGAWRAAVRGITKSWKQFSELTTTTRLRKIPT